MAQRDPAHLVALADRHFHKSVQDVAKKTIARGCRVVLLAGPSSSGKTTTAHLLSDALCQLGHETQIISLDDFYHPEEEAPRREDGTQDFECLEALRVDYIQKCLHDLATSNSCEVPEFDFVHHRPAQQTRHLSLSPDAVACKDYRPCFHRLFHGFSFLFLENSLFLWEPILFPFRSLSMVKSSNPGIITLTTGTLTSSLERSTTSTLSARP